MALRFFLPFYCRPCSRVNINVVVVPSYPFVIFSSINCTTSFSSTKYQVSLEEQKGDSVMCLRVCLYHIHIKDDMYVLRLNLVFGQQ